MSNIEGYHLFGATAEQHVSEPASARAYVERQRALNVQCAKRIERFGQFVSGPRDIVLGVQNLDMSIMLERRRGLAGNLARNQDAFGVDQVARVLARSGEPAFNEQYVKSH